MNCLHSPETSFNPDSFVSKLEIDTDQSDLEEMILCRVARPETLWRLTVVVRRT